MSKDSGSLSVYDASSITSLDWKDHIRLRPGMYIGRLGNGQSPEDGVYTLLKEVIDNSVDEHMMGNGNKIVVTVDGNKIKVRDFGRGIPQSKLFDCVAKINTGAKYNSTAFKKTVGLNGVGIKAVNALSSKFTIASIRDNKARVIEFSCGNLVKDEEKDVEAKNGVMIEFVPDKSKFINLNIRLDYIREMIKYYTWLNPGLTFNLNGEIYQSKRGLLDLIEAKLEEEPLYPPIYFECEDFKIVFTHTTAHGEQYFSFVNGQNTIHGGTHLQATKEVILAEFRRIFKPRFEPFDVRNGMVAAILIRVQEPVFESQTKTKLGSSDMNAGQPIKSFISNFTSKKLDDYFAAKPKIKDAILQKLLLNENERKDVAVIQKSAKESAKKAKVCNKKLRDCKIHLNSKNPRKLESTLFITEGDSASGSITKSRDVNTQAVFSLRGKPLNVFGLPKRTVYENEELYLLLDALGIESNIENLRYNKIIIATDADVDGMHIRLLICTFFFSFFPDLIKYGHVYILKTPLFRVRNKKETVYCYTDEDRSAAINRLSNPEITRFKGLGEISPHEFKDFINENMRLEPLLLTNKSNVRKMLEFYMGKNTPDRQDFIVKNLRVA